MRNAPLLLAVCLFAGCTAATAPKTAPAPAAATLPDTVHWVRNSVEHHASLIQTYRLAGERLAEAAAGKAAGTWAVALDADETVIDNSLYQKELAETGAEHSEQRWAAWVQRREARALPGVVAFLARVHELGGRIAIVTNRREPLCPDTEADFRKHGIPYDVILCGTGEKEPRWQRIARGEAAPGLPPLEILLWVGDNIGDFPDLDQKLRLEPEAAYEEFGVRYFVIPNPMYGSWYGNPRD